LEPIVKFYKKFKKNPVTGSPLDITTLLKLNFANNTNDETDEEERPRFQCPALFKPFNKNSHLVCIRTTGNVFSYEAVEQLNIKAKNWKDLLNDEPFTRKDIITIQDPGILEKFDISKFFYIKNNLRVETEEEMAQRNDPKHRIQKMSIETKEILEELESTYKEKEKETAVEERKLDIFNSAHYSRGHVAASLTSTVMEPTLKNISDALDEDVVRYDRIKKKGYVRLVTNFGSLNLELFCEQVPKTCDNFITHCKKGYFNGTKFHRSIRNFMIQGGDPTSKGGKASGRGGSSIWNNKFEDEFKPGLSHNFRGILSMANSGPNTNGSQFFITYRSCKHLDGKHTIFGKLVGGLETLTEMERIEVDKDDVPIEDIVIQSTTIFVNPYDEVDEELAEARRLEIERVQKEKAELLAAKKAKAKPQKLKVYREGVGKYLAKISTKGSSSQEPPSKKKKDASYALKNFGGW
jgi:peptidyl-prolyl cis-trans isomerase-like protein 2